MAACVYTAPVSGKYIFEISVLSEVLGTSRTNVLGCKLQLLRVQSTHRFTTQSMLGWADCYVIEATSRTVKNMEFNIIPEPVEADLNLGSSHALEHAYAYHIHVCIMSVWKLKLNLHLTWKMNHDIISALSAFERICEIVFNVGVKVQKVPVALCLNSNWFGYSNLLALQTDLDDGPQIYTLRRSNCYSKRYRSHPDGARVISDWSPRDIWQLEFCNFDSILRDWRNITRLCD